MNTMLEFFASNGWSQLVMVLLHSLWQGGAVAVALWCVLRRLPARQTNARYAVSLAALLAVVLGVFVTGSILGVLEAAKAPVVSAKAAHGSSDGTVPVMEPHQSPTAIPTTVASVSSVAKTFGAEANATPSESTNRSVWAAWAALLWLMGCATMFVRLLAQWLDLRRITRPCQPVADEAIRKMLVRLQTIMGVKKDIRILSGDVITGPSVYGIVAPKLLLPPALLLGVPVEQLEAIIAHELAHIRRHDYLVNLGQQLVEAALFFNPAVWWINRQIRIEREACCDRLAVEATGKPEAYAWSLADWVEKHRSGAPVLSTAFGAERNPAGPLERLKRLLVSEYKPVVRLPWPSFAGLLAIAGVLFFGMSAGTRFAVTYAAELLTPAQRIEKMTEIQKNFGYQAGGATATGPADKVSVSGTVELENGTLVETNVPITFFSRNSNFSAWNETRAKNGRFECQIPSGKIMVAAILPHYSPAFAGPYQASAGGKIEGVKVVLRPGYSARTKAVDPQGNPVAGAELSYRYLATAMGYDFGRQTTDTNGIAIFDHLATNAVKLTIVASGYEYDERELPTLLPGEPLVWKLTPAKNVTGAITSSQTGKPVAGAKVRLLHREGKFATSYGDPQYAPVLATSDRNGLFQLDTLNSAAIYTLVIEANDCAPLLLSDVAPGRQIKATLDPQIDIKGKIIGDMALLSSNKAEVRLGWSLQLSYNSSHAHGRLAPVQIRDGSGYFEFTNVFPGVIELIIGAVRTNLDVSKSIDPLLIDMNQSRPASVNDLDSGPVREVILKVRVPKDHPPVTGPFKYDYWSDVTHRGQYGKSVFTNGIARLTIPVPGGISLDPAAMSGCWMERLHKPIAGGSEPVEIELTAIPSGAIYGKVVDSAGGEVSDMMVAVLEVAKSPLKKQEGSLGVEPKNGSSSNDGPTRFSAQPLPLGGKYIILAHRRWTYVATDPIKLTEEHPIQEVTLKLAPGQWVKGKVVDDKEQPVARAEVALGFVSDYSHSFGSTGVFSDDNGEFGFESVNANVPGYYTIAVKNVPGYQPASQKVDFKKSPVIRLKKGVRLEGVVLDQATGNPIPNATVNAWPVGNPNGSTIPVETRADANGKFLFTSMAESSYNLRVNDGECPATSAIGGQSNPVTLRVKLYSWSKLIPLKEAK